MKRLIYAGLMSMMMLIPGTTAYSMEQKHIETYWSCVQMGFVNHQQTVYISEIQKNHWRDYRKREKAFETKVTELSEGKMEGIYDPHCVDFRSLKEAEDFQTDVMKKAAKHGFNIFIIKFKYEGDLANETVSEDN